MSSSKGGHSAKDQDEEAYKKFMIDFEGDSMDYRSIVDIEQGHRASDKFEEGVEYFIRIIRTVYPGEKVYTFQTTVERDKKLQKLRNKMQMINTIFL
jgi:hypothetical protein